MIFAQLVLAAALFQAAPAQDGLSQYGLTQAGPQTLIIDQGRADRIQTPALPSQPQAEPEKTAVHDHVLTRVDATGADRPIKGIRFDGARVPAAVAHAAEAFINQPANRHTLEQLANAMSGAYAKTDVALYTVAFPDQDLSGGTVRVQVAQGFIEDIIYPDGASPLMRAFADRLRALHPLSRSAMERQLSLMRDVTGATVTAKLLRGRQVGGVILSLAIKRKRIDGSVSYDNSPSQLLGNGAFEGQLIGNSLIRDGDQTQITAEVARDFHSFFYTGLSHSTPLGADGLRLNLSGAYLQTRPESIDLKGDAKTLGASLSYPLIRSYHRNLTLSGGLDGIDNDSALYGAVLSSDHIRTARVAAGYSNLTDKTVFSLGATVSKGVALLGSRGTPGDSDPTFIKANATFGYNRAVGKHVVFRLKAQGQYSQDLLPATERFAFGGTDYGRAFDSAGITSDRGAAASLEVALRPKLPKRLTGSEVYGYVDYGRLRILDRIGVPGGRYDLGSAGGGVRIAFTERATLGLEGAKAIKDPFNGELGDWRFNVSWKLSLHHNPA